MARYTVSLARDPTGTLLRVKIGIHLVEARRCRE